MWCKVWRGHIEIIFWKRAKADKVTSARLRKRLACGGKMFIPSTKGEFLPGFVLG
jgi:hypothetical protein